MDRNDLDKFARNVEDEVPGWYTAWVTKRPVFNSVVMFAAGALASWLVF